MIHSLVTSLTKACWIMLASLVSALPACAQVPPAAELTSGRPADIWRHLEEAAASMGAAPDQSLDYTGIKAQSHRIEIFRPADAVPGERYPGLVLFHGGAWREGSPVQFYRQARVIADAGFVVALPEYSISDEDATTPHDALVDAFRAWSHVHESAPDLTIDGDRIYAGGASAGGQLAAALATVPPPEPGTDSAAPAGLVLFNPVIDNGPDGYGYSRVEDYWQDFSPLHNIGVDHPPTVILLGDSDRLIPVATAEAYCVQVRLASSDCSVKIYDNAGHAWFNHDQAGFEGTLRDALDFLRSIDRR